MRVIYRLRDRLERNRTAKNILRYVVAGVIILFIGRFFVRNLNEFSIHTLQFDGRKLAIALLILIPAFLMSPVGWRFILKNLGETVSLKTCFKIGARSQLLKYVPGYIWVYASKLYLFKKLGVSQVKTLMSLFWEQFLVVVSGIIIFFIYSLISAGSYISYKMIISFILLILAGIGIFHPAIIRKLLKSYLFKSQLSNPTVTYNYRGMFRLVGYYVSAWIISGIGFYFLVSSFYSIEIERMMDCIGIFAIAWITGFLTIFVPLGLGVREGVISLLLGEFMPINTAIIISLVARVWLAIPELIWGTIAFLVWKNR